MRTSQKICRFSTAGRSSHCLFPRVGAPTPPTPHAWGEWDFYQTVDFKFWQALKALFVPSRSVLHVVGFSGAIVRHAPDRELLAFRLNQESFVRLVAYSTEALHDRVRARWHRSDRGFMATAGFIRHMGNSSVQYLQYLGSTCLAGGGLPHVVSDHCGCAIVAGAAVQYIARSPAGGSLRVGAFRMLDLRAGSTHRRKRHWHAS
jgi:uncharacterized protein DUF2459